MNYYNPVWTVFLAVLFYLSIGTTHATPQFSNTDYTDYLPRYRTLSENFIVAQIDYNDQSMVIHLHYVSEDDNQKFTFFGNQHIDAWRLTTSNGSKNAEAYVITRIGEVHNIRHNHEFKAAQVAVSGRKTLVANKGDLITCEIHFKRLPRNVRIAHLVGGDGDGKGSYHVNCQDIQIKSKDHQQLGTAQQATIAVERFYQEREAVNFPSDLVEQRMNNDQQKVTKPAGVPLEKPLEHSLKPIDYMPKPMENLEDLVCNERVILSNVYFQDNKAEFSGRLKAMKTIHVIVDYLRNHPSAKIVLHGHTDIFGNAFKNLELSKKRVWTVKSALIQKGIQDGRIITVHHGGSQPLIKYRKGGDANRRVEAEVLCRDGEKEKQVVSQEN